MEITCSSPTTGALRTMNGTTPEQVRSSLRSRWGLGIKWVKDGCLWGFGKMEAGWAGDGTRGNRLFSHPNSFPPDWGQDPRGGLHKNALRGALGCHLPLHPHHRFSEMNLRPCPWLGLEAGLTKNPKLTCRPCNIATQRANCSVYFPPTEDACLFL